MIPINKHISAKILSRPLQKTIFTFTTFSRRDKVNLGTWNHLHRLPRTLSHHECPLRLLETETLETQKQLGLILVSFVTSL